jgi:hypothetical protein
MASRGARQRREAEDAGPAEEFGAVIGHEHDDGVVGNARSSSFLSNWPT